LSFARLRLAYDRDEIMSLSVLPEKARVGALHIAVVAHRQIQYLLTRMQHVVRRRWAVRCGNRKPLMGKVSRLNWWVIFTAHLPSIWLQATKCRDAVWLLGNFQAQCHAALGAW